jgi:glycine/D-amino acid oxidase-like deaminating enzyme
MQMARVFESTVVPTSNVTNVAVIGCGIFGAEIALKASLCGLSVTVYEANADILTGASKNNQNRLHLGFHYPRDLETGQQSIRGFAAFKQKYERCIEGGFQNAYFISNKGSLTSAQGYLDFCGRLGVPYRAISASMFPVEVLGADTGILCEEVVYDCGILRELVRERLRLENINVALGERVLRIQKAGKCFRIESQNQAPVIADVVINCSYADINRLTEQLGNTVPERLFEYTVVPIIRLHMPKVGITIMDGPFMTVLPYGKSEHYLLYNVEHTVVARQIAKQLEPRWLAPDSAPFASMDKSHYFRKMIEVCSAYVPMLEDATLVGFLEGPRMVLARTEDTDARPSIITEYDESYFTVFSGKIDHCMWVADDMYLRIKSRFNL